MWLRSGQHERCPACRIHSAGHIRRPAEHHERMRPGYFLSALYIVSENIKSVSFEKISVLEVHELVSARRSGIAHYHIWIEWTSSGGD